MMAGTQETQMLHADSLDILVLLVHTMARVALQGERLFTFGAHAQRGLQ